MGEDSGIQWTDDTWNPVTGCTKVSPECANCYIERTPPFRVAGRKFDAKGHIPLVFYPERLEIPLRKQRPRRYFVNSLSDLFHDDVPDEFIDRVFAVMAIAGRHVFQVLTKRADRMADYTRQLTPDRVERAARAMGHTFRFQGHDLLQLPLRNVWLGVSAGNQRMWDLRVRALLETVAWLRWVSSEPLLEAINMRHIDIGPGRFVDPLTGCHGCQATGGTHYEVLQNLRAMPALPKPDARVDWVVFGGESGPRGKIRALDLTALRSGLSQCRAVGVPAFVKQMGEVPAYERVPVGAVSQAEIMASMRDRPRAAGEPRYSNWCTIHSSKGSLVQRHLLCQDRKGGEPMEWPEDLRVREWPGEVAA